MEKRKKATNVVEEVANEVVPVVEEVAAEEQNEVLNEAEVTFEETPEDKEVVEDEVFDVEEETVVSESQPEVATDEIVNEVPEEDPKVEEQPVKEEECEPVTELVETKPSVEKHEKTVIKKKSKGGVKLGRGFSFTWNGASYN